MATDIYTVRLFGGKTTMLEANSGFSDDDIQVFIDESDSLRGAAASALISLAGNATQLAILSETLNSKTDGRSMAKEFRADAAALLKDQDMITARENAVPASATVYPCLGPVAHENYHFDDCL